MAEAQRRRGERELERALLSRVGGWRRSSEDMSSLRRRRAVAMSPRGCGLPSREDKKEVQRRPATAENPWTQPKR